MTTKKEDEMYSYGLLEPECYYLIQETTDSPVSLIKVTVETDHCMYVFKYDNEMVTVWKRKSDHIHDIIECLSDEMIARWEKHYDNEESYYEEDDD